MLANLDARLFYLINKNCANPAFDILMPFLTWLGSGEFLFVIAVLILFLKAKNKRAALLLLAGLTVTYYIVYFLKNSVARPRPFITLPDVRVLTPEKNFSFPSTHAAQSFMAAVLLSKFFKYYILLFAIALVVCFSRVYLGVHFVSDVVAGAIIGAITGYALIAAARAAQVSLNNNKENI